MIRQGSSYSAKLGWSLVIAAAIVGPLAVVGVSVWDRNRQLDRMASPDPQRREQALNDFICHAPADPRWLAGLSARIADFPGDAVVPAINAMRVAEVEFDQPLYEGIAATLPRLADDAFLEVARLLADPPTTFQLALQAEGVSRLVSSADLESNKRWVAFLDQMGAWSSPPVPIDTYVAWLSRGVEAQQESIRIHTARQLGDLLLDHPRLDAALVTAPLRRLLKDPAAEIRVAALWAIAGYVPQHREFLDDIEQAVSDSNAEVRATAESLFRVWLQSQLDVPRPQATLVAVPILGDPADDWSQRLNTLDAQAPDSIDITFDDAMPHQVRIAAVRAGRNAEPAWLLDTLRVNDRAGLRDLAVLTLAQRFDPGELEPFIERLILDHDPDARLSGAVLSGLTSTGTAALEAAAERPHPVAVRRGIEVSLWMQGQRPELDGQLEPLLGSGVVPDSTLLLAMLHGDRSRAALDHLLALGTDQPDDPWEALQQTLSLLTTERWSAVLTTYLPDRAPALLAHTDSAAMAAWIADLRAWHALYRGQPAAASRG
ncbi:MAG: hypothetical protein AAF911_11060 [Planctomycetota bacterium]